MSQFESVDDLLADARARISRWTPAEAAQQIDAGARVVDIRPAWQREASVEIPGALIIERNHLEWRLHPGSDARHRSVQADDVWIVVCQEGYTSSLAAASLISLGVTAGDLVGGVEAWRSAGLPVVRGGTEVEGVVSTSSTGDGVGE